MLKIGQLYQYIGIRLNNGIRQMNAFDNIFVLAVKEKNNKIYQAEFMFFFLVKSKYHFREEELYSDFKNLI